MQKERKNKHFIKKPIFPGGLKAMRDLINKELKYPTEAFDAKIEGTVFLRYNIDYNGKVTSSKILSSLGYGCDEEAQRIVKKFIFEVPKGPRKLKIKFHKTIKIHFRLPKETPSNPPLKQAKFQSNTQIKYTIKPTPSKIIKEDQPAKTKSYTYTIEF